MSERFDVIVVGAGPAGLAAAIYAARARLELQAEPASVQEALTNPKIQLMLGHEPRGFHGETALERLEVEELATKQRKVLRTDGAFVFVGMVPRSELLAPYVTLAKGGYVETTDAMETSVPGLYAAGDLRAKRFRQITTAVADGTVAALAAQKFLR